MKEDVTSFLILFENDFTFYFLKDLPENILNYLETPWVGFLGENIIFLPENTFIQTKQWVKKNQLETQKIIDQVYYFTSEKRKRA